MKFESVTIYHLIGKKEKNVLIIIMFLQFSVVPRKVQKTVFLIEFRARGK